MTNQFGPYITPATVENDMMSHLQHWFPTYIGQLERDMGLPAGSLGVENWTTKTRFDALPEEQLPMIVIVSPGTHGTPYKHGHKWCAKWISRVTAITSAADEQISKRLSHAYATAVRMAVLQYQMLNGNANIEGVEWVGDNYNLIGTVQTRTISASQVVFYVEYKNVLDEGEGPIEVTPSPEQPKDPGPWPDVLATGAKITINRE